MNPLMMLLVGLLGNQKKRPAAPGLRFNPAARLDPSQVNDLRGWLDAEIGMGRKAAYLDFPTAAKGTLADEIALVPPPVQKTAVSTRNRQKRLY